MTDEKSTDAVQLDINAILKLLPHRATDQFHPRTGPHTRPHGPHHYRAINYPYPTANFCESGPCQYQPRGLWPSTVCNPLADENSYDRIGCPEAIKVKVPTLH